MNKVILMGRLTADPELRQTQSGIASCRFNIAINRQYADKNTGERQADFISCVAWRQTAEFVSRYFNKGKMIAVIGELRTSTYQDKKHPDVNHYATDVYVDSVEFCGDKGSESNNTTYTAASAQNAQQAPQYSNHNAMAAAGFSDLSDFEELLSDGPVPF